MNFKEVREIKIINERLLVSKGDSIKNASRVVAIGRGAQKNETLKLIDDLANKLGAKIGVTRPLTDLNSFTIENQIGQSGNLISPRLLITLGVHGAVQFTAGINNAEVIVAINNNPKAPIFNIAQYGFIGDATDFVKELLKIVQ